MNKCVNGVKIPMTEEEIAEIEISSIPFEIEQLKLQLAETDYKAIKYAEGLLTDEEYADTKAQRQKWRNKINELEAKLDGNG